MKKSPGTKGRSVSPKNSRKMNDCQKVAKKEEEGIHCFGSSDIEDNLPIYVRFAVSLCYSNKLDKFEIWFNNISKCNSSLLFELMKNEDFCLCIVRLRFFQQKYELVFKLLKSGPFSAREDYVKLWEDAHYKQKEVALGQPLTPVQRFRVRKKFPPPANICPFGRQIRNPLCKEASITLKCWFQEHSADPYPSIKEKQLLAQQTGLTLYQLKTWFANARRRKKVLQMQSSLQRHKLLNKNRFLHDSEQLVALDLSIRNIEMKGDSENVLTDQVGGMNKYAGCLLEQNVEKADVNLRGESPDKKGHEKGQSGSKSSHNCCLYCPEFGEDPLKQTDHNVQQSGPSSKTGTFPNMNLGGELSDEQNSTNVPNSSGGTKSSDLFNLLLFQQMLLEVKIQKNANYFKPFSSLEEMTKSMNHPQSEVQILNKTTYSPSHFPSFNASLQQQVETSHAVPIPPPPPPTPFLISLTNTTQTLPESVCPSTTIYPIPVVTTPGDPPMNIGAFRQDGSYLPGNQNSFKSSTLLSQGIQNTTFQDNSDSYAKITEQESDPAYLDLTPSGASEYPLPNDPCPATETLAFADARCPATETLAFADAPCPATETLAFADAPCPATETLAFADAPCPATETLAFADAPCPATETLAFADAPCPATETLAFADAPCPATETLAFADASCPATETLAFADAPCPATETLAFADAPCPATETLAFADAPCPATETLAFADASCPATETLAFADAPCPATETLAFADAPCPATETLAFADAPCPATETLAFADAPCPATETLAFADASCPATETLAFADASCPATETLAFADAPCPATETLAFADAPCPATETLAFADASCPATETLAFADAPCPATETLAFADASCPATETLAFADASCPATETLAFADAPCPATETLAFADAPCPATETLAFADAPCPATETLAFADAPCPATETLAFADAPCPATETLAFADASCPATETLAFADAPCPATETLAFADAPCPATETLAFADAPCPATETLAFADASCPATETLAFADAPCPATETLAFADAPCPATETLAFADAPCPATETLAFADAPCPATETLAFADAPCPATETLAFADAPCTATETLAFADAPCPATETLAFADAPCPATETLAFADAPCPATETLAFADAPCPATETLAFADAPCPATETLAFAVACPLLSLPNSIAPLSKPPATSINSHLQIIPISNLQPVQMKNQGWNQLTNVQKFPDCDDQTSIMNGHLILDTPIAVDFWNIRKCASASLFFLSHIHSDHTVGLTSSWSRPIYCSKVTGELLCQKVSLSDDLIRPLELHSPTLIPLNPSHTEMVTVTAIDANHCPGSVMFLFQGYFGTILYTGDFRYTSKMFVDSPLSNVSVDVLYLDNTYCDPLCVFGTREEAKEKVFEIIKSYPEHDILLGMQSLGKPDLLIDIAKNLQEYIGVPPLMYKYLEILEVPNVFQVDTPEHECRLRVVPAYYISAKLFSKLTRPTIAVLTTALYVGLEATPYSNQNSVYIVPYSDHSSFVELQEFVKQTQPGRIVPIVGREAKGPFNVSFAKRANMSCFDHFLSKRPQKPFPIPASIDARSVCQSNDVVLTSKRRKRSLGTTVTKSITPKGVIFESSPQKSKNKLNIQKNVAQSRDDSLAPSGSPVKKAIDPDATNSGLKKTCTPEKTTSICVEKPCPPEKTTSICVEKPCPPEKTTSICVEKPCPPEKTTSICVEKPCPPEKTTSICVEKPCPLEKTIRICMEILSPLEKTTPICVEKPCPLEKTTESIGISTATIHADVDIPQTEGKSAVSGREADLTKTSIGNTTGMHLQFSNVEPCTKQKSIPDLKGSDSNGNLNPDSCTRANTPNSDPDLGSRANTPNSNLDLGFRANTPNSDPDLGSRANTPNSNPDLGSRANIPNSNPDLGSRANIPNSNPDLGSRANTPNSDPDLGSQANTPNLNPDVITENHPGLSPMSTGSESGRDHHTQETVSDNHPSLTRVQEPARNPEVDENSEKDTSSTNSSVISIVYNIEPAFQIESLNDDVSTQPQMPTRKRKLPPMFDKEFHSLNKRRCPDNWNSDTRRKKASTKGIGLSGSVCIGKQVQNGETDLEGENEVDTEVISVTRRELSEGCVSALSLLSKTCRPEKSVFTSSISDYVGRFDPPGWTFTSCQAVFFDFVKKQRLRYKSETSSLSQVS